MPQLVTARGRDSRGRVREHFAEYGAWDLAAVERHTLRWLAQVRPARWGRYPPVAVDDTQLPRTRQRVWGPGPVHEASARRPHRAETVRAHHGGVRGDVPPRRPWPSRPPGARLSGRQRRWPTGEPVRPQTTLAADLRRQADAGSAAPLLAVVDGADAVETVIRPCLAPQEDQRRLARGTRVRAEARRYPPLSVRARPTGRRPGWGARMAAPHHHGSWPGSGPRRRAWGDGRRWTFRDQQRRGRGAVSGPPIPVQVFVLELAGEVAPCFLVPSAVDLSAAHVVEAWTARVRPADGVRAHTQRLGRETCRAGTTEPIPRPLQVQRVTLTLLRRLHARLEQAWGPDPWWGKPAWHPHQRHASILDLRRLCWRYRPEFSPFLVHLEALETFPPPLPLSRELSGRAA